MSNTENRTNTPEPAAQIDALFTEENYRLITLAPDLLSCLKDLISTVKIVSTSKGRLYSGDVIKIDQWALDNAIKLIEEVEKKGVLRQSGAYGTVTICMWQYDEWHNNWQTSCGHAHVFIADGPRQNNYKYCPYCGGKLEA